MSARSKATAATDATIVADEPTDTEATTATVIEEPTDVTTEALDVNVEAVEAPEVVEATDVAVVVTEPVEAPTATAVGVVGSTIDIEVPEDATSVQVTAPDGTTRTVFASGGRALYVLQAVGDYRMGGLLVSATAPEVEES